MTQEELARPGRGPVVFVVQEVIGKNILPAAKYGTLTTLLDPREQIYLSAEHHVVRMATKLMYYQPHDFLLAIGDPAAIGIACCLASQAGGGRFRLLKWDRQEMVYYPVEIDLADAMEVG